MSNAIEQLFASGVPSMAQLARMKREEIKKKQESTDGLVATVNLNSRADNLAPTPSFAVNETTHDLNINVPQADTNYLPQSTAPINHREMLDTGLTSPSAVSVPAVVKMPSNNVRAIPPASQSELPTSYDPLKVHQPGSHRAYSPQVTSDQNGQEVSSAKPKKKKNNKKKKQPRQIDHHVPWLDSEDVINHQDDLDDFDMLLKAHEKPIQSDNARNPESENTGPSDIQDIALNILGKSKSYKANKNNKRKQATDRDKKYDQQKSKTRKVQEKTPFIPKVACKYWAAGYCISGDKCTFLHTGEKKSNVPVCRHFIVGACKKGDLCPYSHDLKQEACRHFHVKGICATGEDCPYAHEDASPAALAAMSSKNTPCRFYHLKGFCNSGDACLYSHGNQSTKRLSELKESETCKYFLAGKCHNGTECLFSHVVNTTAHEAPQSQYRAPDLIEQTPLAGFQLTFD
ncbi:hypothetical protein INT43_005547 [Umbelopsis isabellina]|uniref:C3H1-type domain-containing protein n=1 Tax=Mortierella isabellina TaxID=91625 RepID=A0A8H7PLQ4_MORIS|nr:hypothetical protein INT43_005547 [Umbelopsis isabellina]